MDQSTISCIISGIVSHSSHGRNLCYTNATSCFLGGKLLEDKRCPLTSLLAVTLEVDGRESDKWIFRSDFRGKRLVKIRKLREFEMLLNFAFVKRKMYS